MKMNQFILFLLIPIFETIPTSLDELNGFQFGDDGEGEVFNDAWYVDFYGPIQEMRVYCDTSERERICSLLGRICNRTSY